MNVMVTQSRKKDTDERTSRHYYLGRTQIFIKEYFFINSWEKNITTNKRVVIQFLHRSTGSIQSDTRTISSISVTAPLLELRPRASLPLALKTVMLLNWLLTPD